MGVRSKDKDGNIRTDETREVIYQRGVEVKQSFTRRAVSQWKAIQFWVTIIVTVSAAVLYVNSFAKSTDINAKLEKINERLDQQHDKINELGSRIEISNAGVENLNYLMHRFMKGFQ